MQSSELRAMAAWQHTTANVFVVIVSVAAADDDDDGNMR